MKCLRQYLFLNSRCENIDEISKSINILTERLIFKPRDNPEFKPH